MVLMWLKSSTKYDLGGDYVPSGIEVTKQALDDFRKIQEYMLSAKKKMPLKHMQN